MKLFQNTRTDLCGVICCSEYQLWRSVVAGADVRDVRLVFHQDLRASKIAQLQHACARIEQEVLGFDISMADALRVDVGERAEQLVDVELDFQNRHGGLHLVEVPRSAIHGLRYELQDKVEIHLVFLRRD